MCRPGGPLGKIDTMRCNMGGPRWLTALRVVSRIRPTSRFTAVTSTPTRSQHPRTVRSSDMPECVLTRKMWKTRLTPRDKESGCTSIRGMTSRLWYRRRYRYEIPASRVHVQLGMGGVRERDELGRKERNWGCFIRHPPSTSKRQEILLGFSVSSYTVGCVGSKWAEYSENYTSY